MLTDAQGTPLSVLAERAEERFGDTSTLLFEGREHTTADLGAWARRVAGGLVELGVAPGDRVAVCMANCPEVLVTYRAVWWISGVVTPLLFLLTEPELRHALADSGAKVVVTTPEFAPKVTAAAAGLPTTVVVAGDAGAAVAFDELAAHAEAALTTRPPSDPAALLYTGGTTGRSKGVVLSQDAVSAAAWAAVSAGEEAPLDVSLVPLPLAHAFGLLVTSTSLHATRPSRTVLMRWFDPTGWLDLVAAEGVETSPVVPTMLRVLLQFPLESYDLRTLQRLVSGSAPLAAEVVEQWRRRVPGVEIDEGYGCSETFASGTVNRMGHARPGTVGQAAPGMSIRVVDPATGAELPPGVDGEVCLRSASLMTGYWNDPEATAGALRDGWFHTGDIGHLDDHGYLTIVDRLKDVVIRNGFNVYPRDVEEVLIAHPDVAVCAVVGRPDPDKGEEVVAFVQLQPGATISAGDLVAFARERLSAAKYPRDVRIVDAVPLTSIGKLDRKALRARL
ncbi:class I adenylate-forming enzyme family protein [Jatrophihabitans sp. YIM 134969]